MTRQCGEVRAQLALEQVLDRVGRGVVQAQLVGRTQLRDDGGTHQRMGKAIVAGTIAVHEEARGLALIH